MPLAAYFWKVGAVLLALLFVADYSLPRAPTVDQAAANRPAVRIHSDRKWPERVDFDTRSPVIVAAAPVAEPTEVATSSDVTESPITVAQSPGVANSFAMLPDTRPPETVDRKRQRKKLHVAARPRRNVQPQMLLAARRGQFGWSGFGTW
ncbi:hypothetical protein HAP48_0015475 [Bradyrhizobium septentrionale]|uniref:Uncharacterized protein n=1 Tax=Bradyrhizobium septentrionale TaxID=1404411 RepID=A0A973W9X8_9BRAD|nr:hypothetical protein [Bradyrhizobium septentrionale]UGY18726.1 hypothetical protein HAP48_0015475 [Bradyrhizobium septentrionale]UGY27456.1 hypothetical protein HU675_0012220 [Bradyrhizobium septentrionale]